MVFIKSITCQGFKSFRYNTRVKFDRGFSAIVGANGSGKSNIIDALIFVLGNLSAKTMRARIMSDIISNGGRNSKPSQYAFVEIEFDNADRQIPLDSDTVTVSRKIRLNGSGTYKLNGKTTSRKEIVELLDLANLKQSSTNVILQGELFRLINMNPIERRVMVEDIAGIATYDEKKANAKEELDQTEQNINQITILLNEVASQMEQLEKERNDALEFLRLDNEINLASRALVEKQVQTIREQIQEKELEKERLVGQLQEIEAKRISLRESLQDHSHELDQINQKLSELETGEVQELTRQISELRDEITRCKTIRKNLKRAISQHQRKQENLQKDLKQLGEERKTLEDQILSKKTGMEGIKQQLDETQNKIENLKTELSRTSAQFTAQKNQLEVITEEMAKLHGKRAEIASQITILDQDEKTKQREKAKLSTTLEKTGQETQKIRQMLASPVEKGSESELNSIQDKINRLERSNQELQHSIPEIRQQLEKKRESLIKTKSKLKFARQSSSNNRAIEAIVELGKSGQLRGIHGTIATLGTASVKYDTALQVAGGSRFNYIVVDDREVARECIQYLKKKNLGRVSFIPLRDIRVKPLKFNINLTDQIIGRAVDLIQFDPFYEKAFEFVFGFSLVVTDLETATHCNIPLRRITLEGDVVETSNLMTGGSYKKTSGQGFSSVEAELVPKLEAAVNELKAREKDITRKIKANQEEIAQLYREKITSERKNAENLTKRRHFEEKLGENQDLIDATKEELEKIVLKLDEITGAKSPLETSLASVETEIQALERNRSEIRKELDNSESISLKNDLKNAEKDEKSLEKKLQRCEVETAKLETRKSDFIERRQTQLQEELEEERAAEETAVHEIKEIEQKLQETQDDFENMSKIVEQKNSEIADVLAHKTQKMDEISGVKIAISELGQRVHPLEMKIRTLELKIEEQARETQLLTSRQDEQIPLDPAYMNREIPDLERTVSQNRTMKQQLEPVNMKAIQKYDECLERFTDLQEKHERVIQEREAILEFIEEIEREKKRVFMDHFENINRNFGFIFKKLSPNGEAKLELENEEDPFAGGVNMLARPGGKKWCLTQAMSGGEKTLTIIALVLGIQMHVPSPYYILDEIDAALDDANAALVAELIQELSKKSQFILITHRDVTMARVHQLLGVTNKDGVTSVVNMNINEVLEELVAQAS